MKNIYFLIIFKGLFLQINGQEIDLRNFDLILIRLDEVGGCESRTEIHITIEITDKDGKLRVNNNGMIDKITINHDETNIILTELATFHIAELKNCYDIQDSCNIIATGDKGGLITFSFDSKDKKIEKKIEYKSIGCSDLEILKFRGWIMRKAFELSKIK